MRLYLILIISAAFAGLVFLIYCESVKNNNSSVAEDPFIPYVQPENKPYTAADSWPKNIIIMIADGCGYNQIKASDYYSGAPEQEYEKFPVQTAMSTYEYADTYDGNGALNTFGYLTSNATDSASAATAMSTGIKTVDGNIGYNFDDTIVLKHAMEFAEENGRRTGVVTTVEFCHATPAGFIAHNVYRNNFNEISNEMILDSSADVIIGCGNPEFDNNGKPRTPLSSNFNYIGEPLWALIKNGDASSDSDGDGDKDRWTVICSKNQFESYADGSLTCERLLGIPQVYETTQYYRSSGTVRLKSVPSLATMSRAALNVLNRNGNGFMLMIEGGAVDWAGHGNNLKRSIEELSDFNYAVNAVIDWIDENSSWEETLLIVTGDHETGLLTGLNYDADHMNISDLNIAGGGTAKLPYAKWNSGGHSNSLIPFFAVGAKALIFTGSYNGNDPVRGNYIDNTYVGINLIMFSGH